MMITIISREDLENAVGQVSALDPDPSKLSKPTPTNRHLEPHGVPFCIHNPQCELRDPYPYSQTV